MRVLVPFGRTRTVGYLLAVSDRTDIERNRLKRALAILDREPLLPPADWKTLLWAAGYYRHPVGEVCAAAFPVLLRQGGEAERSQVRRLKTTVAGLQIAPQELARAPRQALLLQWAQQHPEGIAEAELTALDWDWRPPARALIGKGWLELVSGARAIDPVLSPPDWRPDLNGDQRRAVDTVTAALGSHRSFLLEGVTGSGKTEVYLQVVETVLAAGRQALLLLPEISLTPQLGQRFRQRLQIPIALFHSGLSESERLQAWLAMQRGEARVLLGTRSAVFAPLAQPGVIIVDEEHDLSFKQQEGFRYSARDVAVMRARELAIPVMLGSATPSLESLANVARRQYARLHLPQRAGGATAPRFRVVDLRAQRLDEGLSPPLLDAMATTLERGEQVLLFLNRRGYAPTLTCHGCGWIATCRRCDANLVIHLKERRLRCHHCGHEQPQPSDCPACGSDDLRPLGLGTERIERALAKRFPDVPLARIDRDNTRRKGSLEQMLEDARSGRTRILLGTQMLAKGHHFPAVTLAALLDVDAGLFSTDFRGSERTAQLIMQVAGRAGREQLPGTVILQTRHPDHPLLTTLINHGYGEFAEAALAERRAAGLPPYGYQALWRAEAGQPEAARRLLERLAERCSNDAALAVFGPAPAPLQRKAGRHRFQLLLQADQRPPLQRALKLLVEEIDGWPEARQCRWALEVDPLDFG
ncbi:MAG: primosomal protein N' [Methylococcaceae bacterium]|nr:primosomal protein N' [Methylococcaceae bacterium]